MNQEQNETLETIKKAGGNGFTPKHYADAGFAFRISSNVQIDVSGGKGLNN